MKVRVWGYRDGTLLPCGFQVEPAGGVGSPPFDTLEGERAAADGLVALVESLGIEVCIGTDARGEFNEDVEIWEHA